MGEDFVTFSPSPKHVTLPPSYSSSLLSSAYWLHGYTSCGLHGWFVAVGDISSII